MITITPINFDPAGPLTISQAPRTDHGDWGRRANRVATLDGGVAVNDFGFSEGDRTVVVRWNCTQAQEARAKSIVSTHRLVRLANTDGSFEAVPERFTRSGMEASLTLLITRRLN
jgi:hypothetical protein